MLFWDFNSKDSISFILCKTSTFGYTYDKADRLKTYTFSGVSKYNNIENDETKMVLSDGNNDNASYVLDSNALSLEIFYKEVKNSVKCIAIKSDIAAIAKLDEQLAEFRFLIFGKPPNLRLGGKIFNTYAN